MTSPDGYTMWTDHPRPNGPGAGGQWSTLAEDLDVEPWAPATEEVVSGD